MGGPDRTDVSCNGPSSYDDRDGVDVVGSGRQVVGRGHPGRVDSSQRVQFEGTRMVTAEVQGVLMVMKTQGVGAHVVDVVLSVQVLSKLEAVIKVEVPPEVVAA